MTVTSDNAGCPTSSPPNRGNAATDGARGDDPPPRNSTSDPVVRDHRSNGSAGPEKAATGIFASIDNLREIMGRCLEGEPLDHDLAEWLGEAVEGYLTRQFRTLEEALGLVFPRGGIPWWREEAIRKRDAALRYLAETFHDDVATGTQAREIWTAAKRYAASAWRFDCDSDDMPEYYAGTQKECLWQAFKSGAPMPLGERQLRNILAH